ncbi:MFS transporter [Nocardia higoensis]|uniref:MFS transporter n=1 Tax=Nocardia higoensis TaxID=228599 RepID=UPI000A03C8AE|nr:MFS transporter [Nocardia higoensis]
MSRSAPPGFTAPLRVPRLRMLLLVQLGVSVGMWMLVTVAQWLLTTAGESASTVSAVQLAASLPFFLLALPVAAVVDSAGHRRMLVGTALALAAVAPVPILAGGSPPVLTAVVFVAGAGLATTVVVWQALMPRLVTPDLLAVVPAVDGAVVNGARALGPVMGGAVLAAFGANPVFIAVAVIFGVCAALSARYVPASSGREPRRESVRESLATGLRFIRHSGWTRRLLVRATAFGVPAGCLWALLPVVADERMRATTVEFGLVSGAVGVGAVVGTVAIMPLRSRMSWNHFVALGSAAYAVVLLGLALNTRIDVAAALMVLGGTAWVGVQSTWMIAAHSVVPPWIKTRVIAFVMVVFQGGQAVGALLWGRLADALGLVPAILVAAAAMAVSAIGILRNGIRPGDGIAPDSAGIVSAPIEIAGRSGRVTVETTYRVTEDGLTEFLADIAAQRTSRLRLGALRCVLLRPADADATFVEYCVFRNHTDYLAQETERMTVPEYRLRERVARHLDGPPEIRVLMEPSHR